MDPRTGIVHYCIGTCRKTSDEKIKHSDKHEVCPDTGATSNMFNNKRFFCTGDYQRVEKMFVYMGDGKPVPVRGIGTAIVEIEGKHIESFPNSLYITDLKINLVSVTRHKMRGQGHIYHIEDVNVIMSWPNFSITKRIPDNADPQLTIKPLTPEQYMNFEDQDSKHTLQSFDLFRSRCAFIKQIHKTRVMTRS